MLVVVELLMSAGGHCFVTMPKQSSNNKGKQAARREVAGSNSDRSRSGHERTVPAMTVIKAGAKSDSNAPCLMDLDIAYFESDSSTPPRTLAMQQADRLAHQQQLAAMDQGVTFSCCAALPANSVAAHKQAAAVRVETR